ncbi:hypothetical protein AB0G81_25620 [Streptomyces asoensis]|uniref:hypothetical protein n=1 Tax=Streptomyces asoensis TaxID=249586 RepID=UPI00340792B8
MREKPETVDGPSAEGEGGRKRIDLSVPQVAGSAVAAVVAAKLASYAGVYGTILGAGLVSVVATCGGTLFQHFFRRTGEQLREAQTRDARPAADPAGRGAPGPGEFGPGTVHRARGRRRPVTAAALVFAVAMAGITTYELVSGDSFDGDGGTTVGQAVTGGGSSSGSPSDPSPGTSGDGSGTGVPSAGTPSPSPSSSSAGEAGTVPSGGTPSSADGGGDGAGEDPNGATADATTPAPTATGGGAGTDDATVSPAPADSATSPAPSADSRSGSGAQDPGGPAAP